MYVYIYIYAILPLVEYAIDFSTAREFICIYQGRTAALDGALKVRLQLLDHSAKQENERESY